MSGPDRQPGYAECRRLAQYLASLDVRSRGYITNAEAETAVQLWGLLTAGDRARVAASARYRDVLHTGRFKRPKTSRLSGAVPGVESARR